MTTSDQQLPVPQSVLAEEKRIAHSGALARIAGACARHPWRVVFGWLGVFVALIALNAAFHGHAHQRLQDPRVGYPEGDRPDQREVRRPEGRRPARRARGPERAALDTAARHGGDRADARCEQRVAEGSRREPEGRLRDHEPAARSRVSSPTTGRSRSSTCSSIAPDSSCRGRASSRSRTSCARSAQPAGMQVEFTGEAESAPPTQGLSDIIGLLAAFVILMVLFRALVPTVIPLLFAIVAVIGAFLILFLAARLTHFNTITRDPGADDRPRAWASTTRCSSSRASDSSCTTGCRRRMRRPPPARPPGER